jgi:hypothetical protein
MARCDVASHARTTLLEWCELLYLTFLFLILFILFFSFSISCHCLAAPLFSNNTTFSVDEMRQYMEQFAKKRHFDPLIAETWYTIKDYELNQFKVLCF